MEAVYRKEVVSSSYLITIKKILDIERNPESKFDIFFHTFCQF